MYSLKMVAQDVEFSQPYMNPLYMNPANTGLFNNNIRGVAVYRNQWSSLLGNANSYVTTTGSVDFSLRSGDANHLGLGILVNKDAQGNNMLSTNSATISGAYNFALRRERDYFLCIGMSVGFNQRKVDINTMTFGTQFVNGFYDPSNVSYESPVGTYRSFTDLSVGTIWYHFKNPRNNQYIGFSVQHINNPNMALILSDVDYLYRKYTFTGGLETLINKRTDFMPQAIMSFQGPYFQLYMGCLFKFVSYRPQFKLGGDGFSFGPYLRFNKTVGGVGTDAVVVATRYDINHLKLGLSYDVNISTAFNNGTNGLGGPEVSFIYEVPVARHMHSKDIFYCPQF